MRALVLIAWACMVVAAEPSPGPVEATALRAAFLAAIDAAPELRAAQARLRAAILAAGGAGVLPDPRLWAEGARHPTGKGLEFGVDQDLPRWGERSAARSLAQVEVERARIEVDRARGDVASEVAMLLVRAEAARRRCIRLCDLRRWPRHL